jgi:hypothetical protein
MLTQTITQLGWAKGRAQLGIVAQGVRVHLDDNGAEDDPTPVMLMMRLDRKLRMELGSGDIMTISDAGGSIQQSGAGKKQPMLAHVALSSIAPYFPFLTDLAALNDPAVRIVGADAQTLGGEPIIGITVTKTLPGDAKFKPAREKAAPLTLWISTRTGLPVKLDFYRLAIDDWTVKLPYSLYFSNWRQVDGVLVPMQIDEASGTRVLSRMRFSSIQFNSAIPDSEFQGGGN